MTQRRYYLVTDKVTDKHRLVRATHPSTALRHVAADAFTVRVASQDDLLTAIAAGVKVETIAAEQTELPTT